MVSIEKSVPCSGIARRTFYASCMENRGEGSFIPYGKRQRWKGNPGLWPDDLEIKENINKVRQ